MELLQKYKAELKALDINAGDKALVAVSGGLDSMVLLDLTLKSGLDLSAAHLNYNIRGEDSLKDEELVREYCISNGIHFSAKHVDLSRNKLNDGFQAEARKVRYKWFEELRAEQEADYIFTAHHLNDRVETLFINLLRGAGLKGLKSIPRKKGKIRRPLLSFEKSYLEEYANENKIPWRLDKSNMSDKYLRNKIRLGMFNAFHELSARSEQNAGKSMDYLAEADEYFQKLADDRIAEFTSTGEAIEIKDSEWVQIFREKPLHKYVFEKLGFYTEQLEQLENFDQSQSGKKIEGNRNLVYRDREKYIVKSLDDSVREIFHIVSPEGEIDSPVRLKWQMVKNVNNKDLKNPNLGYLNLSKLSFPLTLRPWKEGDRFRPFGMKGSKKLSDFLIDSKVPIHQKEKTYVLLSGSEIVWVLGHRTSNQYAVRKGDKSIIRFEEKH